MQQFTGYSAQNLDEYQVDSLFSEGFGAAGIAHKQCYYDPWQKKDMRTSAGKAIAKSMQANMLRKNASIDAGLTGGIGTGGAGTAGSALIPVWVVPEPVDRTHVFTPIIDMLPRVAVRGKTYEYNAITAKGGAGYVLEDGAVTEDIDTYDRVSVPIKLAQSSGKVTAFAIEAMKGFLDAQQLDLGVKIQAMRELQENTIINGNASSNSAEFTGLISGITTNTTDKSGAAVTLANIRAEFATTFQAKGAVNLVVTDAFTHNSVKGLLQEYQRVVDPARDQLPFGIPGAFEFDGVVFIKHQNMPTTASSRRMLFLDTRYLLDAVLMDETYKEVASGNTSAKYTIEKFHTFVNTFEGAMSQIFGIQ